jgi:hypothetical protein
MFDTNWSFKHDIYNLICLPVIIALNLYVLIYNYTNSLDSFAYFFLGYLIVDFVWITLFPCSVSSPKIILIHHFITILGVGLIPYLDLGTQNIILLGSLVETNTLIRIVRKYFRDNIFLNILFYTTWFAIRCILGPILLFSIGINIYDYCNYQYYFNNQYYFNYNCKKYKCYLNLLLFSIGLILNLLNLKWTIDLVNASWKKLSDKDSKGL